MKSPPLETSREDGTLDSKSQGGRSSPLLPIFLIVLVDVLGFTIILPLLPFYSERLGVSPTVVGMIVAIYAACQLLAGPILGQISDRIGRRPVLLLSQAGTLAGFLLRGVREFYLAEVEVAEDSTHLWNIVERENKLPAKLRETPSQLHEIRF